MSINSRNGKYTHTMEYDSAMQKNKLMIQLTTKITPTDIMLHERNQTQRKTLQFHLYDIQI